MKLTEFEELKKGQFKPQRVLAFGDSKSGKTELAGKLAEKFQLWWFDLENGHSTLLKLPTSYKQNINLFVIPDTRTYPVAIETMLKVVTGAPVRICMGHGKVSCEICLRDNTPFYEEFCLHKLGPNDIFVVDSGTQLGNSAMNNLTKDKGDDYKPDWDDFRRQGFMLDRFLSNLQQGRYNSVVLTHTTLARMEDATKTKMVPVMGTDNFSRNVAKYFDHVIHCDIGSGGHAFGSSTTYRPQILTGSRTDVTIERFQDPKLIPFFTGERVAQKEDPVLTAMASLKRSSVVAGNLAAAPATLSADKK